MCKQQLYTGSLWKSGKGKMKSFNTWQSCTVTKMQFRPKKSFLDLYRVYLIIVFAPSIVYEKQLLSIYNGMGLPRPVLGLCGKCLKWTNSLISLIITLNKNLQLQAVAAINTFSPFLNGYASAGRQRVRFLVHSWF